MSWSKWNKTSVDDVSRRWITGSIYGRELHEFGARGLEGLFQED